MSKPKEPANMGGVAEKAVDTLCEQSLTAVSHLCPKRPVEPANVGQIMAEKAENTICDLLF